VLWGWLFLDESVTLAMLAGVALVIGALVLVVRR
jgi:LPXTG-motif cell wall-anchored protein